MFNKRKLPTDHKHLGQWGEERCEKFLKRKGFKTLTRNFSCKAGEIDLIMVDTDGTIVFVEVKTRKDESFDSVESVITSAKKHKLKKTVNFFLASNDIHDRPLRFDVVTIVLDKTPRRQIRHYKNAFVP